MGSSEKDSREATGACLTFDGKQRRRPDGYVGTAVGHPYLHWNERESEAVQPNLGSLDDLAALRDCSSNVVPGEEDSTAALVPLQTSEQCILSERRLLAALDNQLLGGHLGPEFDITDDIYVKIVSDQLLDSRLRAQSGMTSRTQNFEDELDTHLGAGDQIFPLLHNEELEKSDVAGCAQGAGHNNEEILEKHNQVDLELEKYLIVKAMLGGNFTAATDPSFEVVLNFHVDVFKSFLTGVPQHCSLECPLINEPASCCWNERFTESIFNMKRIFQRDITLVLNDYLEKVGKKVCNFPTHCTAALREWTTTNYGEPYMSEAESKQIAKELGLTQTQIEHWLENWRVRKWKTKPVGQKGRKGKYFRHPEEDTAILKCWILDKARHPIQREAETLSQGSSMTPDEIRTWCYNYRKRHKNLFVKWK